MAGFALLNARTVVPILMLWALLLTGCNKLPDLSSRPPPSTLPLAEAQQTAIGQSLQGALAQHPGQSGFLPLTNPEQAFATRLALADQAQRSLDIQYYIWQSDISGTLLLDAVYRAAERGVRVRMLLDDNGTQGLDWALAALDRHPNIEVRLFNPFTFRAFKPLGFITNFSRANRRMHNKSFTADNEVSIVGGRNIGDEYFGASQQGTLFADMDVLAVGAVVPEVSSSFDRYWASVSSYPVAGFLNDKPDIGRLHRQVEQLKNSAQARNYRRQTRDTDFGRQFQRHKYPPIWAKARLVADDPAKGVGQAKVPDLLIFKANGIIGKPEHSLDLVSPYFVPTRAGIEQFRMLRKTGVRVRVLTNALETTDVVAVHAVYAKRRRALLHMGVELYEMRATRANGMDRQKYAVHNLSGIPGQTSTSLHAKTFAVDGHSFFVGSFNFDARSARLNTEMGFVIDSPELANQVAQVFDRRAPREAYKVGLDEHGHLYWLEHNGNSEIRHHNEPGAGLFRALAVTLLSWLPIDWLL